MILNMMGAGQSVGNMVETTFHLSADHYFYPDNHKNYLEIPNIQLSGGRLNTVLIYLNYEYTSNYGNGCIYNLFHTQSVYDTGTVKINGRFYYVNPTSGNFGSSSPFNPGDGSEFIYDVNAQKVRVFLPLYSNDIFLKGGVTYQVAVW